MGMASDTILNIQKKLPFYACGKVVSGFGRGSKELGIPTANFPDCVVDSLPSELVCGVYCGWAKLQPCDSPIDSSLQKPTKNGLDDKNSICGMVMSIGWNPFYKNEKRTMETHILRKFGSDFYGRQLKVLITQFIRPMWDFKKLDDLIAQINDDIQKANEILKQEDQIALQPLLHPLTNNGGALPTISA